jgi:polyphenol oxidase
VSTLTVPQNTQSPEELQPSPAALWRPFGGEAGLAGGISQTADGAMSWLGDNPEVVAANHVSFLKRMGLKWQDAVSAEQVHGTVIHRATRADGGRGMRERDTRLPGTDGFVTNEPGLILTTLHADCLPLFYADLEQGAIGLAHAGWRGIVSGLPGEMLDRMAREFGSDPRKIRVAIGPAICPRHYGVDESLAQKFAARFGPEVVVRTDGFDHPCLDLVAAATIDLLRAGLDPAYIPSRPPCTFEHPALASYRRDGAPVRSMLSWLCRM